MQNMMTKVIKYIHAAIKKLFQEAAKFRIEEIDTKSRKVVISRMGMQTILKISLIDAVRDRSLISNLASDQACWLGYYCGKMCRDTILTSGGFFNLSQDEQLGLEAKKGKYKILSQDRKGLILFYNLHDKTNHTQSPLDLISDKQLINEFDPTQACYIGILAGLLTPKQVQALASKTTNVIKPFLRLVG
jgi:hypothetical protein